MPYSSSLGIVCLSQSYSQNDTYWLHVYYMYICCCQSEFFPPCIDVFVGFNSTVYRVEEGDIMVFCAEVVGATHGSCLVNFPFNISITTADSSAGDSCSLQLLVIHCVMEKKTYFILC